jgi:branched-subunit amino acid transport protein AzlD
MTDTFTKEMMIVIAMVIGTLITRFLPFLLFPAGKETPKFVTYLGTTLPYATMALLVVYCLKGVTVFAAPHGLPELIAVLTVVLLHWYKKNSLLSIAFGTIVYMFLIQKVF